MLNVEYLLVFEAELVAVQAGKKRHILLFVFLLFLGHWTPLWEATVIVLISARSSALHVWNTPGAARSSQRETLTFQKQTKLLFEKTHLSWRFVHLQAFIDQSRHLALHALLLSANQKPATEKRSNQLELWAVTPALFHSRHSDAQVSLITLMTKCVAVSQHAHYHDPETEAAKWNAVISSLHLWQNVSFCKHSF